MMHSDRLVPLRALAVAALVVIGTVGGDRPAFAITAQEHFERAQGYFEKGELDASIIELKNALQRDRENADARLLLGRAYVETGRGAAAEKELERAQEFGIAAEDLRELIGQARLLQGNYEGTLQGITIEPSDAPARKAALFALRGAAQLGLGNTDEAKQSFTAAVDHDPANPDAHVGLGQVALRTSAFEVAEAELAKALAADPTALSVLSFKGDLDFARNAYPEAERAYVELVDAYPFIPHVLRLAYVRSALGKNDEAIVDIERVLRVAPQHLGANYLRALAAYQTKDYDTAKFHVDQALAVTPLNPQFHLLAGATNYALGINEQAHRFLKSYLSRNPSHEEARKMLGATLLRLGNAEEARTTLKPFEGESPIDDVQLLSMIGMAAVRTGDLEGGRHYFERLVEVQPDNPAARAQLGAVQIALGQDDEGIIDLEKAVGQDPNLDQALISLIVAYLRNRQYEVALESATRLRDNDPENALASTFVGMSYIGLGDLEAASQAFSRALELKPGAPDAAANLAAIKIRQGKSGEARDLYTQVLEHNPDHLRTLLTLAKLERQLNRPAEELTLLERAVKQHPKSRPARIALGHALVLRGNAEKALLNVAGLLDEVPDDPAVLQLVGEAQLRVGDTDEALDTFRRLVEARPDHAASHFHLARAFEAATNLDKADIELQKTLLLDPGHRQAKFARARILVGQGNLELAKSLLHDFRSAFPEEFAVADLEARIALAENRPQDAVGALQQALEKRPEQGSDAVIRLSIANAGRMGAKEGSLRFLQDWVLSNPQDMRVRFFLANSLRSEKRYEAAVAEYLEIVKIDPNNLAAVNNLANSLMQLGRAEESLHYAKQAFNLAPENPAIKDTLAVALLETGDVESAVSHLREAARGLPENAEVQVNLARALIKDEKFQEAGDILEKILEKKKQFPQRDLAVELLNTLPR